MYYNSNYLYDFVSKAFERKRDRQIDSIIDSNLTFEDTLIEIDKAVKEYNQKDKELKLWKENPHQKI